MRLIKEPAETQGLFLHNKQDCTVSYFSRGSFNSTIQNRTDKIRVVEGEKLGSGLGLSGTGLYVRAMSSSHIQLVQS